MLIEEDKQKIQIWIDKFPKRQAALLMSLRIVQDRLGYLPNEALDDIAKYLEISPIQVYEVVSFYSMYRREKGAKHQIKVCNSLSCCLAGAEEIVDILKKNTKSLDVSVGMTECLGACAKAPVAMLNDIEYLESLDHESLNKLVTRLEKSGE
jgi:NADH:ubiquinone oxidoreductase subunit E